MFFAILCLICTEL